MRYNKFVSLVGYPLIFISLFVACNSPSTTSTSHTVIPAVGAADTAILHKMDTAISNGTYPNIHSLLISKNCRLLYEKYWPGHDEVWAVPAGIVRHAADSLHDIRSITKSIVSACMGIAIEQGKIKDVDQQVFNFFPEYIEQDTGLKAKLTIEHLLTMSAGLKWN